MKKSRKKYKLKTFFKILILIVLIIALFFIGYTIYQKIEENKYKKILQDGDATNFKITEIINDDETNIYVRDKILLIDSGNTKTWVNESESKRVSFDEKYHTVIIEKDVDNLKVNSLNYTYINDFFENSNQVFKYLGKENGNIKIQFKEKGNKKITVFYIDEKLKTMVKMIQNVDNFETITDFKIEKNSVSKQEVELPDLENYRVYDSAEK